MQNDSNFAKRGALIRRPSWSFRLVIRSLFLPENMCANPLAILIQKSRSTRICLLEMGPSRIRTSSATSSSALSTFPDQRLPNHTAEPASAMIRASSYFEKTRSRCVPPSEKVIDSALVVSFSQSWTTPGPWASLRFSVAFFGEDWMQIKRPT